jgi:RNA polymerase sigma-70 factor (ECF subfamily)
MPTLPARTHANSFSRSAGQGTSDGILIQRIAAGNRLAMQVLYIRHRVRVYRHIVAIVGNEEVAEDLLSDTFLEVWRNAPRFRGQAAVATWLLAIARNKAISAIRRSSPERLDNEFSLRIAEEDDGPEIRLQKKQAFGVLRRSLIHLSPKHREVISLVYYHDKSPEEVAAILGTPRNTIKTRMFYARRRLGELLTAAGVNHAVS